MAQLLINDAESAIAEANPPISPEVSGAMRGVNPQLTSSEKVTHSQMRTAAAVWADRRDAVEADPEAVVPTRAALIREASQNRQGEAAHLLPPLLPPTTDLYHQYKAIIG